MRSRSTCALVAWLTLGLSACGGGSDDGPGDGPGDTGTAVPPLPDDGAGGGEGSGGGADAPAPIEGDIARYGVVAVGDEGGEASDLLASFSRLSTGVAPAAFGDALATDTGGCRVEASGPPDLMDLSVVFVPSPANVALEPIGAGETVTLSGPLGTYAQLEGRPSDRFYTVGAGRGAPSGAVPDGLVVDVPGGEFPAFPDATLPDVEPLDGVDYDGGDNITADTRFTWQAGGDADARVRIVSSTAGGFFLDDGAGLDVACLVPDTGEFVFPPDVRAMLGADFDGAPPSFSRVALRTERQGDALLVLVRESLVP